MKRNGCFGAGRPRCGQTAGRPFGHGPPLSASRARGQWQQSGKGAEIFESVLTSAAANAEEKNLNADELYVSDVYANQGPTMKRWRPGPQERTLDRKAHV